MNAAKEIKTMKLYSDVERIYNELKQLGYNRTDPLKLEDVTKFDQYHYLGTDAVDESIKRLGISSGHQVLDFGSGLGGPARHIASKTGCKLVAIELQDDLNQAAEDLTKRCGLSGKIQHKCGDILKPDTPPGSFDFLVAWMVILHIADRKTLFKNCFDQLKPGGKIYIEDLFKLSEMSAADVKVLREDLYLTVLPAKDEYQQQMKDAGFTDIQFEDITSTWRPFVAKRLSEFRSAKEQRVKVLGQDTYDGLEYFYSKVSGTFETGSLGGCRIVASKPN